jgi:hypothetical protein
VLAVLVRYLNADSVYEGWWRFIYPSNVRKAVTFAPASNTAFTGIVKPANS